MALLSLRAMRVLNVGLAAWAALWIGLGAWIGYEVNGLRTLSDTVVEAGTAVHTTGDALDAVGRLPLVGGEIGTLARQVRDAGASAETSGRASRGTIDRLAVLLGLAVGLVPTVPVLALYLPWRRSWQRDRCAVHEALQSWGGEAGLEDLLARRALLHLRYAELRDLAPGAWRELDDAARKRLADEELRRLGLER